MSGDLLATIDRAERMASRGAGKGMPTNAQLAEAVCALAAVARELAGQVGRLGTVAEVEQPGTKPTRPHPSQSPALGRLNA